MPMLQVDGQVVAEIDEQMADKLVDAASVGIGRLRYPANFQFRVEGDLPKPARANR